MTDRGAGAPLVLIPGIQGRWEWMLPAVDALAARCRVITGSLPGDAGSIADSDPAAGFERHTAWLDALLDRAGVRGGVSLCGVSYGGWIALHYAAVRPTRVRTLTLVSTPSPSWQPGCRVDRYLAAPRLMSPVFALGSSFRLYPEIAAAFPPLGARSRFIARHLLRVARHPLAPTRMAERVRDAGRVDFAADCARVAAPTQVVTGAATLDHVVAVDSTKEYLRAIPGSRYDRIERTGHLGLVTRPERFADVVTQFVQTCTMNADARLRASA
jgi:pimeloyl-ACP methyl ester carboxylesterase